MIAWLNDEAADAVRRTEATATDADRLITIHEVFCALDATLRDRLADAYPGMTKLQDAIQSLLDRAGVPARAAARPTVLAGEPAHTAEPPLGRPHPVAFKERVSIVYRAAVGDEIELPLRMLIIGDFTQRPDPRPVEDRTPIRVDEGNFSKVMAEHHLALLLVVPDELGSQEGGELEVSLRCRRLSDFEPEAIVHQVPQLKQLLQLRMALSALQGPLGAEKAFRSALIVSVADPTKRARLRRECGLSQADAEVSSSEQSASLLDEILAVTKVAPGDESYEIAKTAVRALLARAIEPKHVGESVGRQLVEAMIAEIDGTTSRQLDAILHHEQLQKLESAWRSLRFVINRVAHGQNIAVDMVNLSKEDLSCDFEDAPELAKSGLYKLVNAPYATPSGSPYGLVVGNYEFEPAPADLVLLRSCAAVAAIAHAPFLAGGAPQLFDLSSYVDLPLEKELKPAFDGPERAAWQTFREGEDSRYVGLCLPRFLLRLPYGCDSHRVKPFFYEESVPEHRAYLWGNSAFALATRVADSFAKVRLGANIVGQDDGAVVHLPLHQSRATGVVRTKGPTEAPLTEEQEHQLSSAGFIGLTAGDDACAARFPAANSCQIRRDVGQSGDRNFGLDAQLSCVLFISRFAHYLKVIQRTHHWDFYEQRSSVGRAALEQQLRRWISGYVADGDYVSPAVRALRPLRNAWVTVEDVPGNTACWRLVLRLRPHAKHLDHLFTLSLVDRLVSDRVFITARA
jgi:type VI secretion system protein ImpC